MSKGSRQVERVGPALLAKPREEARGQLLGRAEQAQTITAEVTRSVSGLDEARSTFERWNSYNEELIRRMFTTEEYFLSYRSSFSVSSSTFGQPNLGQSWKRFEQNLERKVNFLSALAERLDLIDEAPGVSDHSDARPRPPGQPQNTKIFLVHGQNEEAKAIVARFVEKCGLAPIILHEQADQGRTIIEKFEQEADVGFAIILLTPDDVGGLAEPGEVPAAKELKRRARQNVILELGYFIARLGRTRVCALRKGDVELPSDFNGVIYTPLGVDGAWKMKLATELKAAGYAIDLNIAFA